MPVTKQIFNKSTNKEETAILQLCPRCKGYGRVWGDDEPCFICNGEGECFVSENGWTLPYDAAPGQEGQLY